MMREVDADTANQAAEAAKATLVPTDGPGSQANCPDGACQDPTSEHVGKESLSSETSVNGRNTSEDGTDSCECSLRPG